MPDAITPTVGAAFSGTLRVVTKSIEPFVIVDGDRLSGFSIDLWDRIAQDLGLKYRWIQVKSVGDQLDAVRQGAADVAIAGISITPEREKLVDFTHPVFNAGLQIMTRAGGDTSFASVWAMLTSPALIQILLVGFAILLVMALVIWLVERHDNPNMPKAFLPGIWEGLWWATSTLGSNTYVGSAVPVVWRRLLAMFWVLLSIILIAQFTASITSLLTVQQLTSTINGPHDLPGKRVATVQNTTAAKYLTANNINFTPVAKIDDAYDLLDRGRVQAIVYDAPVLLYRAATRGEGTEQMIEPIFQQEYYGVALPTGSPLRKPINEALLRLRADGTYDQLYEKWFGAMK